MLLIVFIVVDNMKTEYIHRIQKNYTKLLAKCKISADLLDIIHHSKVLEKDIHYINKFSGLDKSRFFFIELTKHGDEAFATFIKALKQLKQNEVVELLDPCNEFHYKEPSAQPQLCYPFALPKETKISSNDEDALDIKVIPSKEICASENGIPTYSSQSKNRGYVLIINVNQVTAETERVGSSVDVKNLTELFTQMGLQVLEVKENPTKEVIQEEITSFVNNKKLSKADVVFSFFMSHGSFDPNDGDFLYGSDRKRVYTSWIIDQFSNDVCIYMQQRPKILIFQTCRGMNADRGTYKTQTDGGPSNKIAAQSDILIVNSTLKGYVSHRDLYLGTWYIYCFCKIFMKQAKDKDVETLLKLVNQYLSLQRSSKDSRQTAEYINRHFKTLYLNPGIYVENGVTKEFHLNME